MEINLVENNLAEKQRVMHKDIFDRCRLAIDNGFYFEALLLEYSAFEGRLEVILGILGLPCNKELDRNTRKGIQISHRLGCLKNIYKNKGDAVVKSKLSHKNFEKMQKWVSDRNVYIHGLTKNAEEYNPRLAGVKRMAENGYEYMNQLYNEANRLRRLYKNHPEAFAEKLNCSSHKCNLFEE